MLATNKLEEDKNISWILYVDRALNFKGSYIRLILTNLKGVVMEYMLKFNFNTINNGAKYEALISSLKIAKEIKIEMFKVFSDS